MNIFKLGVLGLPCMLYLITAMHGWQRGERLNSVPLETLIDGQCNNTVACSDQGM